MDILNHGSMEGSILDKALSKMCWPTNKYMYFLNSNFYGTIEYSQSINNTEYYDVLNADFNQFWVPVSKNYLS